MKVYILVQLSDDGRGGCVESVRGVYSSSEKAKHHADYLVEMYSYARVDFEIVELILNENY